MVLTKTPICDFGKKAHDFKRAWRKVIRESEIDDISGGMI